MFHPGADRPRIKLGRSFTVMSGDDITGISNFTLTVSSKHVLHFHKHRARFLPC